MWPWYHSIFYFIIQYSLAILFSVTCLKEQMTNVNPFSVNRDKSISQREWIHSCWVLVAISVNISSSLTEYGLMYFNNTGTFLTKGKVGIQKQSWKIYISGSSFETTTESWKNGRIKSSISLGVKSERREDGLWNQKENSCLGVFGECKILWPKRIFLYSRGSIQ